MYWNCSSTKTKKPKSSKKTLKRDIVLTIEQFDWQQTAFIKIDDRRQYEIMSSESNHCQSRLSPISLYYHSNSKLNVGCSGKI